MWGSGLSELGSPAPAGIDLPIVFSHIREKWFPRTRGDRPVLQCEGLEIDPVPPHPRG